MVFFFLVFRFKPKTNHDRGMGRDHRRDLSQFFFSLPTEQRGSHFLSRYNRFLHKVIHICTSTRKHRLQFSFFVINTHTYCTKCLQISEIKSQYLGSQQEQRNTCRFSELTAKQIYRVSVSSSAFKKTQQN